MAWKCRSSPRASRRWNNSPSSLRKAVTACRAICSASPCRSGNMQASSVAPKSWSSRSRPARAFSGAVAAGSRKRAKLESRAPFRFHRHGNGSRDGGRFFRSPFDGFMSDYDLAIIGGGLNGVSLARDAAGRGLRVILLEQGDLGGAASSATPRLIHGDLSVLERRGFRRVRRALAERRTWLRIAPHLVRPKRFVIPAHSDERPAWQLRSWLLFYDRLTSRSGLPATATLDITHHPVGNALKRPFGTAFEYFDCVVDDSRLVVLTALDAAERGAV